MGSPGPGGQQFRGVLSGFLAGLEVPPVVVPGGQSWYWWAAVPGRPVRLLGRVRSSSDPGQSKTEVTVVLYGLYTLWRAQPLPLIPPNQPMRVQY